ncbi:MAG TPA: 2-oxoglutarate dehydrogenase complex dihydrolipoyllysine-residue succinyltransferase [Myxococcaceae bacterium]|nr:2-oxoglutarate dehydrogenase complex dihydrolipoyllysine-residue succinyltransferase [Myxococcaceae bacterium]
MAEVRVPPLGESITQGVISKWLKNVGEAVKADEPVVTLETDKVTVDVPSPATGALTEVKAKEGETVKVGDLLGVVDAGAAAQAAPPTPAPEKPEKKEEPQELLESGAYKLVPDAAEESQRAVPITPVAKKIAEERGVDTTQIQGSGLGGKITKEDVMGAGAPEKPAAAQAPVPVPPPLPPRRAELKLPSGPRPNAAREERVRMTPLRKRVAERLVAVQQTAAILTTFNEVDMSAVMALRKQYGEKFQAKHGTKLGFMSFFVKASLEALKAFPQLNAEIEGEDVVFKHYFDIGVAVSGSRGLVVPVLRDADGLSMAEMEKQIADFAARARSDKLTLPELQGGTFTITNGGIFGSMMSTPILNPPQTGILGMHNIVDRPVVRDGAVVVRPIMYVALSYDHRLVDGREAVQFLVRIKDCIEDPERLLLEI